MSPTQTERERYDMRDTQEREISLGTSTVLGIFFALALVCAVFFGLGYTMGRKSAAPTVAAFSPAASPVATEPFKSFKPAPGNPTPAVKDVPAQDAPHSAKPEVPPAPEPLSKPHFDPDAEIVTSAAPVPVKPAVAVIRPPAAQPTASGSTIVQVLAFRRQEDAETVASALRKKGYTVYIRLEPQDALLHVQLGPYATKKDAEAMKDRLSADGFNAILK